MRKDRTILTIAIALVFPQLARAQTRESTGTVTVAGGTVPIAGSTIVAEGATAETRSSNEGHFRLTVPAGPVTLIARAIGYKRGVQVIGATQTTANFALERDVL